MAPRIWDRFLTPLTRKCSRRPALLIVDVNYQFCGDRREPILQAIERWRNACGEAAWDAVDVIARLAPAFRARGLPVIYTTGAGRSDGWDRGGWQWKNARNAERPPPLPDGLDPNSIVSEIAPLPQDI